MKSDAGRFTKSSNKKQKTRPWGRVWETLVWLFAASQPEQPSSANAAWVVFVKLKKKLKGKRFKVIVGASYQLDR
jgi:hypothetical protein